MNIENAKARINKRNKIKLVNNKLFYSPLIGTHVPTMHRPYLGVLSSSGFSKQHGSNSLFASILYADPLKLQVATGFRLPQSTNFFSIMESFSLHLSHFEIRIGHSDQCSGSLTSRFQHGGFLHSM